MDREIQVQLPASSFNSRIRRGSRQSGGIYCGNVERITTVNRKRDIVIRRD